MKNFRNYFEDMIYDEGMIENYLNSLTASERKQKKEKYAKALVGVANKKLKVKTVLSAMKAGEDISFEAKDDAGTAPQAIDPNKTLFKFLTTAPNKQTKEDAESIIFTFGENSNVWISIIAGDKPEILSNAKVAVDKLKNISSLDEEEIQNLSNDLKKLWKALDGVHVIVHNGEVFRGPDKAQSEKVRMRKSSANDLALLTKKKKLILKKNNEIRNKIDKALSREIAVGVKVPSASGKNIREITKRELDEFSTSSIKDIIKEFWKMKKEKK